MRTTDFQESLRYEYPLNPESFVIDIGAHTGVFSAQIYERYKCYIHAYEPIREFYDAANERLKPFRPKVKLFHAGVGPSDAAIQFGVKGDMTGAYTDGNRVETVNLWNISYILPFPVSLLKINIEGAEYDLLDAILDRGLHERMDNIQVQFHGNIPNARERWKAINERLTQTHELTYYFPFCWENYARR